MSQGRAAVAAWQETCPPGPVPGAEHGWVSHGVLAPKGAVVWWYLNVLVAQKGLG